MSGEKYKPESVSKNPDDIRKLPYISNALKRYLKDNPVASISRSQSKAVRSILKMAVNQPFDRCRGKRWLWLKEREAEGDFSHSKQSHLCDECQCMSMAGKGSKGDFYGLGPETGHIGVGYCHKCERHINMSPGLYVRNLRIEVKNKQTYGTASMNSDSEYTLKVAKAEAAEVAVREQVRADITLVHEELARVKSRMSDGLATEMTPRGPEPMADSTRTKIMLDIAKTMMHLDLGNFKLSEKDYLHVDELKKRMPEMMTLVYQCMAKIEELSEARNVHGVTPETDRPIQEYVGDIFRSGMNAIWDESKLVRGRK